MMIYLPPQGTPPQHSSDTAHRTHSTQPALRPHRATHYDYDYDYYCYYYYY